MRADPTRIRRRRTLLLLALVCTLSAAASWWPSLAMPPDLHSLPLDPDLAFAVHQRAAEMHAFCDPMERAVRGHCDRCYTLAHPLVCGDPSLAAGAQCEAFERGLHACLEDRSRSVDGCLVTAATRANDP